MAKASGLGKGLDALFSTSSVLKDIKEEEKNKIVNIKLTDIEPNKTQARKEFKEEAL